MKVTIGYVNPPREGKTNGSLRLTDGSYLSCPPNLLPLFEGTENTTVDIATRQFKGSSGDMVTMVDSGPGGMRAPAPPRPPYASPKPVQGGPVGVPQQGGLQADRRLAELEKFFEMYITGSVGRHLGGGGKAVSEHTVMAAEAVRVFEQVIGPAFLRLSNLLSAPKVPPLPKPVPIETWTNNTRTTPNSEPGDPGPVELQ
jgi:hypothetical protein